MNGQMTTTITWYDTVLIGILVLTFILEAFLIRRERVLGWVMMIQTTGVATLFAWAFFRRLLPYLNEWPYTAIRIWLLVSCILVIAILIRERYQVGRDQRGAVDPD
jgi:hypothetical protein